MTQRASWLSRLPRLRVLVCVVTSLAFGCGDDDGATSDGGTTDGGGMTTDGGMTGSDGGMPSDGSVGDDAGAVACVDGRALFVPTGGEATDVTDALRGNWTAPSAGTLRLCGGSWTANVSAPAGGGLRIESADGLRATLTGNVQVIGDVIVESVDVEGLFYAAGGSIAMPSGQLGLVDVHAHTIASQAMFDGAMRVEATDSTFVADGSLLGVVAGVDFTQVEVTALKVDRGSNPLLFGGSLSLVDVTATTTEGGFMDVTGEGTTTVRGCTLTTRGNGPALQISNATYTVEDVDLVSDGVGGAGPLLSLMLLSSPNASTMTNLDFTMNGERGGISGRSIACTGCTFDDPAVAAAIEVINGGGLTLVDCDFTGTHTQRFVSSASNGIHRVTNCSFTGGAGQHGAAIYVPSGQLFVTDSEFTDNRATGNGGAVAAGMNINSLASLIVSGSTFTNNTAGSMGGAIWTANPLQVSGSTFTGNTAVSGGGAILTRAQQHHILGTSTFHSNDGGVGAAVVFRFDGTHQLQVTSCDFGTGATDNTPNDVQRLLPSETLDPAVTRNAGAGASFTCDVTCR
ncbi:MAG: right-handed parallel beta-helix repeat-containing protein [Polyangiales bacterium]